MKSGLDEDQAEALSIAFDGLVQYRKSVSDRAVKPCLSLDEAVDGFRKPLAEEGLSGPETLRRLIEQAEPGLCQMTSPNFYGLVLGGSHPVGVAADLLVSGWGQNAGSAAATPSISGIERAVCDWVIDLLGLPPDSGAGIVTGGSMANTVGIMAARNALLAARGWDVEEKGLFGAPEIPVLISEEAHSAPFAALRYAGFGAGRAMRIATGDNGRMQPSAVEAALKDCVHPPLAVLQAGHINTGAFDPFAQIIPMIREKGGWVHVDGAFGLWLACVPELADRLQGVHDADSWATDLHKWLNAPFDAGMVICRDRKPLVASMTARGPYLPETSHHWEPADSAPELSRRARGVPSYAIMRHLGKAGIRALVLRHCRLAEKLARLIAAEPGLKVLNRVDANQVAIGCGEGPEADRQTRDVLKCVQDRGKTFPSHGKWRGREIIRVSIINYATADEDIEMLASEIIGAWREIRDL